MCAIAGRTAAAMVSADERRACMPTSARETSWLSSPTDLRSSRTFGFGARCHNLLCVVPRFRGALPPAWETECEPALAYLGLQVVDLVQLSR